MGILSRLFKKRKHTHSSEQFKIILRTDKELSEEQKNAIFTIVSNGIRSGEELNTIGMRIFMHAGITSPLFLNRIKNGVEVILL